MMEKPLLTLKGERIRNNINIGYRNFVGEKYKQCVKSEFLYFIKPPFLENKTSFSINSIRISCKLLTNFKEPISVYGYCPCMLYKYSH